MGGNLQPRSEPHGPHLVLVLEARRPTAGSIAIDLGGTEAVEIGRGPARSVDHRAADGMLCVHVRVDDPLMSPNHARLLRKGDDWVLEPGTEEADVNTRVNGQRVQARVRVQDRDLIELGETFFVFRAVGLRCDVPVLESTQLRAGLIGRTTFNEKFYRDLLDLERVARSGIAVMLIGETGCRHLAVARSVHTASGRRGLFVEITETRALRSQLADMTGDGTNFIDNIDEWSATAQAALVHALHGARGDARFVTSSTRAPDNQQGRASLRGELLVNLGQYQLTLPSLRHVPEDLGLVIGHLLQVAAPTRRSFQMSGEAVREILSYHWPYNHDELAAALTAALELSNGGPILPTHLPQAVRRLGPSYERAPGPTSDPPQPQGPLSESEQRLKAELESMLLRHEGNISAVARESGKARMQIHRWLKRFSIDPTAFRP